MPGFTTPSTVEEWAALEAKRLVESKKVTHPVAITRAARLAPGLLAAAEGIHSILSEHSEAPAALAIPEDVAQAARKARRCEDKVLVSRLCEWLAHSPHELRKANSVHAAFAVAAQVALLVVQTRIDPSLEATCREALAKTTRNTVRYVHTRHAHSVRTPTRRAHTCTAPSRKRARHR